MNTSWMLTCIYDFSDHELVIFIFDSLFLSAIGIYIYIYSQQHHLLHWEQLYFNLLVIYTFQFFLTVYIKKSLTFYIKKLHRPYFPAYYVLSGILIINKSYVCTSIQEKNEIRLWKYQCYYFSFFSVW